MSKRAWIPAVAIAVTALALSGLARSAAQEAAAPPAADDLTVVKRAVAQAPSAPAAKATTPAPRAGKPTWFKVRVVDKGSKKTRVTVNMPLALVRAIGDTPIDWKCGTEERPAHRCSIKVADVLEALEAGQELVEVDDEQSIVKVWVE
jgi:hypothetical protein